ncbi:MAG: right-handed parallel beta-helix repeat-containing protein, partial [Candidatus Woesearchaeota archaeon]
NSSICQYQNISGAIIANNNTAMGITLRESDRVYTINSDYSFYMPLDELSEAVISINAANVTLDCNGSEMEGDFIGYGIHAAQADNISIHSCKLKSFARGIYIEESNYSNASGNIFDDLNISIWDDGSSNILQNNTILNCTSSTGCIVVEGDENIIKNNVISTASANSIYLKSSAERDPSDNNISYNTIMQTDSGYDLLANATSTNVWLNSFYSRGAYDAGSSSDFCIGGEGNFYAGGLNKTYIEDVLEDCGTANLTHPEAGESYKGIVDINWTKQSSPNSINYHIYYSNDSGANWAYLTSTSDTSYTWDTTWLWNYSMPDTILRIVPYDSSRNATPDNTTGVFNITVNNNWVCSNSSYCEYRNISSALDEQNGTGEPITLMDGDETYSFADDHPYYFPVTGGYSALNISNDNITLDCNDAQIRGGGDGHGIYSKGNDNITILNCRIYNYDYGLSLISGNDARTANTIINTAGSAGLKLSGTNSSTVEHGKILGGATGNVILENSHSNTLRYLNLTGSGEQGIYLDSSGYNTLYSINSSANSYENVYLDSGSGNNTFENCTFDDAGRHGMLISGDRNNISTSSFANISSGYFDIYITSTADSTGVWLNNFYSQGVNDSGTDSFFCVNNSGNYYNPNISSTYRVTGTCGNLSEAYLDKDNDGYYTIYDCNDRNDFIYPGAKEYCDKIDNDCDGIIDEGACEPEKFPSAGTGGTGGGAGFSFTTYKGINISEEPEFTMAKYEKISFTVKGQDHSLEINKVYEDSVNLTIRSDEINLLLGINETRELDLDNDDTLDLRIKLTSIRGTEAGFSLEEIWPSEDDVSEEEAAEEARKKAEQELKEKEAREKEKERPDTKGTAGRLLEGITGLFGRIKKPLAVAFIVIVALGVLSSGFFYYRSVVERIKPAEDFIDSSLERGESREKVRKELLEAGWDEETINSLIEAHSRINRMKDLREYIKRALDKGFTKEQVKKVLLSRGWKEEDIDRFFR